MAYSVKDLPYEKNALKDVVSEKALEAHHDKLYAGYVAKRNEIEEALKTADKSKANHNYSEFRALKLEEVFNADGQILHELYFDCMRTSQEDNKPSGELLAKIEEDFGSFEAFCEDLKATGLSARGWAVTAYDPMDGKIHNFLADFHSHGGVWNSVAILALDSYEHAFFMDYGPDKKSYIEAWFKVINWDKVSENSSRIPKA